MKWICIDKKSMKLINIPLKIKLNCGFVWKSHQFLRYIDVTCHTQLELFSVIMKQKLIKKYKIK